jgi:hypothetical protein
MTTSHDLPHSALWQRTLQPQASLQRPPLRPHIPLPRISLRLACCALALLLASSPTVRAQDDEMEDVAIDPLTDIALDMEAVVADLSVQETGKATQETQATIVKKLDALIESLERELEAASGGGASGANPQRPLQDSMIIGGPGGIGDLRTPRELGKNWGELPPKERERILQSLTEGFPPHYQKILEHYYRRLAAEQAPADSSNADGAAPHTADDNAAATADPEPAGSQTPASDAASPPSSKRPAAKQGKRSSGKRSASEGAP